MSPDGGMFKNEDDDAVTWTRDHTGWLGQYHVSQPKRMGEGRGQDAADSSVMIFHSFQPEISNRIITCMLRMTITTTLTDSIAMLTSSEADLQLWSGSTTNLVAPCCLHRTRLLHGAQSHRRHSRIIELQLDSLKQTGASGLRLLR
jgi:hypothetical protein